jgi:PleD family two-component response regulator
MGRIILAEDDEAMRRMVSEILTSAGHAVRSVPDGRRAIAEVRSEPPDLIVLDYRMGQLDGFQVCRTIKEDPRLEHVPVLILTAEGHVEDRIKGFAAGANDYLAKPFDARELLARVQALLRLSEQGRGLNPTTGLPGGIAIEREFERRHKREDRFTLCYFDLDYFKPFNDRFGFSTADLVIESLGTILKQLVAGTDHFAGHIGGDDFVVMCETSAARRLVEEAQVRFREALARHVPAEVVQKGAYRGRLRNGTDAEVPLTRIACALLHLDPANAPTLPELGELAAATKERAKSPEGGGVVEVEVRPD